MAPSSGASNGSGELVESLSHRIQCDGYDDLDCSQNDQQKTKDAVEHILIKIQRAKDMIKEEQKARDGMLILFPSPNNQSKKSSIIAL